MKLGVLTGVEMQHRYFARRIHEAFGIGALIYEAPGRPAVPGDAPDLTTDENHIVAEHFIELGRQQERTFGPWSAVMSRADGVAVKKLAPEHLSGLETIAFLSAAGVDTLAIFGTSLIGLPLLTRFAGRCLNLLPGLAPYYRGPNANIHALLDEKPEYVGATIHLIDSGLNTGPIFAHARPELDLTDEPAVIVCKAVATGIECMVEVLRRFADGHIRPVAQWPDPRARLATRKDSHPRQIVELYRKLSSGMLRRYVSQAARRNAVVRLVDLTLSDATPPARA
jgi:folate-dependent phosphoribosylglycinamide formyltransferase PurN